MTRSEVGLSLEVVSNSCLGKFGQSLPQPNFADLTGALSRLVIGWLLKPVGEPGSQLAEYVYGPACETDGQLAVIGIQDMAEVAHRVYPAIERSLGVENFSPGAGVDAAPCTTTPARWTPCTGAWVGITRHFYE